MVTQVLYILVTQNWSRAVIVAGYKNFVERSVMIACHFCPGIGGCEPSRLQYIKIIQQLLQKIQTEQK